MSLSTRISPIPTEHAEAFRAGAIDANGQTPVKLLSDGSSIPCRHCLNNVNKGDPYLVLSYRPFEKLHAYAESGPIFLHAEACNAYPFEDILPSMIMRGEPRLVRAYNKEERIIYGTGKILEPDLILQNAHKLFENPDVSFIHVRSSENNCYTFRVNRCGTDS